MVISIDIAVLLVFNPVSHTFRRNSLMALGLATIIFAIIGGIKANEGELWEYPGTIIRIFK